MAERVNENKSQGVKKVTRPDRSVKLRTAVHGFFYSTACRVLETRKVLFRDGELSYDYLVLAAGAETAHFGHDLWRAWTLKTIEDGVEMWRRILLAFEQAECVPAQEERKSGRSALRWK